ncbi:unnamed protein product [Boreogadus saida]
MLLYPSRTTAPPTHTLSQLQKGSRTAEVGRCFNSHPLSRRQLFRVETWQPLGGPEAGQVLGRTTVGTAQSSVPSALYVAAAVAAADLLPEAPGPVSLSVPPHTIWPVLPPLAACGVVAEWWQL